MRLLDVIGPVILPEGATGGRGVGAYLDVTGDADGVTGGGLQFRVLADGTLRNILNTGPWRVVGSDPALGDPEPAEIEAYVYPIGVQSPPIPLRFKPIATSTGVCSLPQLVLAERPLAVAPSVPGDIVALLSSGNTKLSEMDEALAQSTQAAGLIPHASGDETTLPSTAGTYRLLSAAAKTGQVWRRATNGATPERVINLEAPGLTPRNPEYHYAGDWADAIEAADAAGGAVLTPRMTYTIPRTVTLTAALAGNKAVINCTPSATIEFEAIGDGSIKLGYLVRLGTGAALSDVTVDATRPGLTYNHSAITLWNAEGVRLERCFAKNASLAGVLVWSGQDNHIDCDVSDVQRVVAGSGTGYEPTGIMFVGAPSGTRRSSANDNRITRCGQFGIDVRNGAGYVDLAGNKISEIGMAGVPAIGLQTFNSGGSISLSDNTVSRVGPGVNGCTNGWHYSIDGTLGGNGSNNLAIVDTTGVYAPFEFAAAAQWHSSGDLVHVVGAGSITSAAFLLDRSSHTTLSGPEVHNFTGDVTRVPLGLRFIGRGIHGDTPSDVKDPAKQSALGTRRNTVKNLKTRGVVQGVYHDDWADHNVVENPDIEARQCIEVIAGTLSVTGGRARQLNINHFDAALRAQGTQSGQKTHFIVRGLRLELAGKAIDGTDVVSVALKWQDNTGESNDALAEVDVEATVTARATDYLVDNGGGNGLGMIRHRLSANINAFAGTNTAEFSVGRWRAPERLGAAYVWTDGTGALRRKATAPTSDTDGTAFS